MKKIILFFALVNCSICFAQEFSSVKIYITNPFALRSECIKTQMYNKDYVRCHYATCIFSLEQNYIKELYDSLQSFPLTEVARDSVFIALPTYWGNGTIDMDFEPCIVIDFIYKYRDRFNTNDEVWTFSINKKGYICRSTGAGDKLFYPNKKCGDFLKSRFPGLFIPKIEIRQH